MSPKRRAPFEIGGSQAPAGRRTQLDLPIARLMSGTPVALPAIIYHGLTAGPVVWITAAIHGDEIGGVEIIRRVANEIDPKTLQGTLIALPVVNVHGFNTGDRYLPDRRDLNRSFPGSRRGSLAGRVANLIMSEIVDRSDFGIDLHTGSGHRTNLPQIRADLDDAKTLELADVFCAPITIHSRTRDGSLREAATATGATVLLYEGGEAERFDPGAISAGVKGVRRVLHHVGMTEQGPEGGDATLYSRKTRWVRAQRSGILDLHPELGDRVSKGDLVGLVRDPYGKKLGRISAPTDGLIIGHTQHPLVNRGDAVLHIASL